jgi:hypothetical protein
LFARPKPSGIANLVDISALAVDRVCTSALIEQTFEVNRTSVLYGLYIYQVLDVNGGGWAMWVSCSCFLDCPASPAEAVLGRGASPMECEE